MSDEWAIVHAFPHVVRRDFGYYRDCEYRLANALDRSAKYLRDTSELVVETAEAAEETAAMVKRILFTFPRSVPVRSGVILRFPHIKVLCAERR